MKRYFTYVGEEDIRLVYNDVNYMGQFVSEHQFRDDSGEENEEGIKALETDRHMGQKWDYYMTENGAAFFTMPCAF